jgi:hypothetical protein
VTPTEPTRGSKRSADAAGLQSYQAERHPSRAGLSVDTYARIMARLSTAMLSCGESRGRAAGRVVWA